MMLGGVLRGEGGVAGSAALPPAGPNEDAAVPSITEGARPVARGVSLLRTWLGPWPLL